MRLSTEIRHHLYERRYFYLLMATILQVFLSSFFPDRETYWLNGITYSIFMLALINFLSRKRRILFIALFLAFISVLFVWIPVESDTGQKIYVIEKIIVILFLMLIITQIIIHIVKSREVSLNMILGVITIYVLFGLLAGDCNQIIYFFDHNAFAGNIDLSDNADIRYYSYVTITTLGYGDIVPVSQLARASSVFFSLTAQIYLAVVIALIVGKYVSHSDKKESVDAKK